MTRQAIERITGKHLDTLTNYAKDMQLHTSQGEDAWHREEAERMSKKIRGYLEALENCQIITHREMQALYLYFRQIGITA